MPKIFQSWPVWALVLSLLLGGCATVPMASLNQDSQAKAFQVSTKESRIYIYRNEIFGGAVLMTVSVDGKVLGHTSSKTFLMVNVPPGSHKIESVAENIASLSLDTEPGKAYYVWQEVKMGVWMARSALHEVPAAQGQKGVLECKLAQSEQ